MPYEIQFEEFGRGVLVTLDGSISGDELIAANEAMYSQDHDGRLRYQIWDHTGVEHLELSESQLRHLSMQDREAAEKSPGQVVALVGSRKMLKEIEKIYSVFSEAWSGFESARFGTIPDARRWIEKVVQ
jgi:hypothetical protein